MLNYRALTSPSPNDANLRTTGDPLGMLREGGYDNNRYLYTKGSSRVHINNLTSDPFNHILGLHKNAVSNLGGIVPFPPKQQTQTIGNEYTNNPGPLINALVAAPVLPQVSELVDKPLPPNINPIAVK